MLTDKQTVTILQNIFCYAFRAGKSKNWLQNGSRNN